VTELHAPAARPPNGPSTRKNWRLIISDTAYPILPPLRTARVPTNGTMMNMAKVGDEELYTTNEYMWATASQRSPKNGTKKRSEVHGIGGLAATVVRMFDMPRRRD
jgi:hypothetical protein